MTFRIDPAGWSEFMSNLTTVLTESVDEAIAETKERVHIKTGRLQSSVRREDPQHAPDEISVDMVAGGSVERGVFMEMGLPKEVDYALEEEVRHPNLRRYFPPAVKKAFNARKRRA